MGDAELTGRGGPGGRGTGRPGCSGVAGAAVLLVALAVAPAGADDRLESDLWSAPRLLPLHGLLDVRWQLTGGEEDEPDDAAFASLGALGIVYPWRDERHEVMVALEGGELDIDGAAVAPGTGRIENEYRTALIGLTWRRVESSGALLAINLTGGSRSDELFDSADEVAWGGTLLHRRPVDDGAWLLGVTLANDRPLLRHVPLPIIARQWKRGDWTLTLGFPTTAAQLRDPDGARRLEIDARVGLTTRGQATWRTAGGLHLLLAYEWQSFRFMRADRRDAEDLLLVQQWVAGGGLEWRPARFLRLQAWGGWAFARSLAEGSDLDELDDREVDLDPAPTGVLRGVLFF